MDKKLVILYFVNFSVSTIYTSVIPFYPIIADDKGVDFITIGAIIAIMPGVLFISSNVVGKYLERMGRNRTVLIAVFLAGTSLAISSISILFDKIVFIVLGFSFRIVSGIALAMNLTAVYSVLSSDYKENFQKVVGLMEMCTGLGIMVGPVITSALYPFTGAFWSFMAMAILIYLAMIPAYCILGKERPYEKLIDSKPQAQGLLTNPVVLVDLSALCMVFFGFGPLDLMLTTYLVSLGCSTELASIIYIISSVTYTIFAIGASMIPDSIDKRFAIFMGLTLFCLGLGFCGTVPPFPPSIFEIAVGSGLLGAGGSIVIVAVIPHIMHHCTAKLGVPQDDQLSDYISSKASASISIGLIVGPLLCGLLAEVISLQACWWVFAAILAIFTVIYVSVSNFFGDLFCCRIRVSNTDQKTEQLLEETPS